ncbi:MAG: hypothetical protein Q8916_13005 [Bacteroidota bacterium]|nr:hypothetical protein [Bacteroidota bacterium]MDP4231311.1 hypothetical protein [Bacteroidota bacterium]MDP4236695.1 hypothetical protein [Bacteroidota bacterium]
MLTLLTCVIAATSQATAQEHLLGQSSSNALAWARSIDSSVDYDTAYHRITLSHLSGYERWNFWPAVDIIIDSTYDRVKQVILIFSYAFKPLNVLSRSDRKKAIRDLTKEFGMPVYSKTHSTRIENLEIEDDGESWHWADNVGSYDFIRYRGTNACVLECNLLPKQN